MSKRKNIHVVPRNDGWVVRSEGSSRATSVHKTQRDAIVAARDIARKNNIELVIHGRDGRIRGRDSYGSDPMPPRDRQVLFPDASASTSGKAIRDAVAEVMREFEDDSETGTRSAS